MISLRRRLHQMRDAQPDTKRQEAGGRLRSLWGSRTRMGGFGKFLEKQERRRPRVTSQRRSVLPTPGMVIVSEKEISTIPNHTKSVLSFRRTWRDSEGPNQDGDPQAARPHWSRQRLLGRKHPLRNKPLLAYTGHRTWCALRPGGRRCDDL